MPCQAALIPSSHGQASKSEPGGSVPVSKPAALPTPLFERDPISTRVVRQGPHGLQLFIQLDKNVPPRTDSSLMKRGRNGTKQQQSHQLNDDIDHNVGEELIENPTGSKRSKTSRTSSTTSIPTVTAATNEDNVVNEDSDNDIRSMRSYSDRINRYFEQIEDADSWNDSSQTILVVLGDVMRHVQTFGLPDPNNDEHSALHEEIRQEVAQIEHLVHDYTENLRRMKTNDPEEIP